MACAMQVTACSASLRRRFSFCVFFSFFFFTPWAILFFVCEGVLSLVNYTQRCQAEGRRTGGVELRQWAWRILFFIFWLLFNSGAFWHRCHHRAGTKSCPTLRKCSLSGEKGGMDLTWLQDVAKKQKKTKTLSNKMHSKCCVLTHTVLYVRCKHTYFPPLFVCLLILAEEWK